MNDNLKMFLRYGLAIGVSFAVAKGWITPETGEGVTKSIIEIVGVLVSFAPALYAAIMIRNTPKP